MRPWMPTAASVLSHLLSRRSMLSVGSSKGVVIPQSRLRLLLFGRVLRHVVQQLRQRQATLLVFLRMQDGPGALINHRTALRPWPGPASAVNESERKSGRPGVAGIFASFLLAGFAGFSAGFRFG